MDQLLILHVIQFIISMSCLISFTCATPTLMITHDCMLTLQDDHNNFVTQMILEMFRQPAARLLSGLLHCKK